MPPDGTDRIGTEPGGLDRAHLRNSENARLSLTEEHLKYLHEAEVSRMQRLRTVCSAYLALVTTIFTAWVTIIGLLKLDVTTLLAAARSDPASAIGAFGLFGAMFCLAAAFVFFAMAIRVEFYERLCDPGDFALFGTSAPEDQVRLRIISNYAVAATRNFAVNETRAQRLHRGLIFFFASLALFFVWGVSSIVFVN